MIQAPSTTPDPGWMGDRKRGASLGRPQVLGHRAHRDNPIRFHLRRIRLDSAGYDPGGAYWGHGGELFEAWDDGGEAYMTVRIGAREVSDAFAKRGGVRIGDPGWDPALTSGWHKIGGREAAKDAVRETYPNAKFYR